jgi:hypothetical protein
MRESQITFPDRMECTHIYPDGRIEDVIYGKFEAIMVTHKNGWALGILDDMTTILTMPNYYVEEVIKTDGTKVVFKEPFLMIHESNYGDNSGRVARKIRQFIV